MDSYNVTFKITLPSDEVSDFTSELIDFIDNANLYDYSPIRVNIISDYLNNK